MSAKGKGKSGKGPKGSSGLRWADGWRLAAVIVALIVAGCIPAPGTDNCFYILIPYVATFVAAALCFSMLSKSINGPSPRDKGDVPQFVEKLKIRSVAGIVLAIATSLGEVIFVLLNGVHGAYGYSLPAVQPADAPSRAPWAILFFLLMLAVALCFASLHRLAASTEVRKR